MTTAATLASAGLAAGDTLLHALDGPLDERCVGAKAANLARVRAAGLDVPAGIVLTTAALRAHVERHALTSLLQSADRAVAAAGPADRMAAADAHAATIGAAFLAAPLDEPLREALSRHAARLLLAGPVVVRSSAVGEDSATESYAGQLDSVLGVTDLASLELAVRRCWASCWSARALAYRAARGLAAGGMGVIVQRQVAAAAAGVLFTRVSDGAVVVEYVAGLADRLVAGEADPARLAIAPGGIRWRPLAETTADAAVAEPLVTDERTISQLASAAERLEETFGAPQDVEWVLDATGALLIVQSRPITATLVIDTGTAVAAAAPGVPPRAIRWSNANIAENFPAPVSPLLYSIARAGYASYFRNLAIAYGFSDGRIAAMDEPLRQVVGAHGGRLYYNLTSIHSVLRTAPYGAALVRAFNRFVGATEEEGHAAAVDASAFRQRLEVVRIATSVARSYATLGRRIAAFERMADDFAARAHPDRLAALDTASLRRLLAEFMEIRCRRWTNAGLADAAAMVSYAVLHRMVEGTRDGRAGALHNTLLKAIPDLVSGEPVHRLWELSRLVRADASLHRLFESGDADAILLTIRTDTRHAAFRARFDAYVEEWGFRCSEELMLTVPSYQEQPAPLVETIRAYARQEGDGPAGALRAQLAERDAELARLLEELRWRRLPGFPLLGHARALRIVLHCTRVAIACRERARLKQALLYSRCRRLVLALGERLAAAGVLDGREDAFWLDVHELLELAAGGALLPGALRETIAARRRAHERAASVVPPDSFVLPEGAYFEPAAAGVDPERSAPGPLRGTGACGGQHTGRAAVLRDVTESGRLTDGEVLVTRQTDPGWAPAFFLVRGLVIERGGMLSHGAIVAREFGIPCVVGVRGATAAIPDGATVTVDGDRGTVDVHD